MLGTLRIAAWCAAGAFAVAQTYPGVLDDKPVDPFAGKAKALVFVFVRTDCPISNRYAPELNRLYREFTDRGVAFWMVYPDASETREAIVRQLEEYRLPGRALRDPSHALARRANVTIAPEAAVFSSDGRLVYHGRIDNRYVEVGKAMPSPTRRDLEEAIAAVVAGRAPAEASAPAVGCFLAD